MSSWGLSPRRLYTTVSGLGVKTVIPKNPHKNLEDGSFRKFKRVVPSFEETIHPFYSPNILERAGLCMSETTPELMDGKPVVPAIIKHPRTSQATLVNSKLHFDSVEESSKWLQYLRRGTMSNSHLRIINEHDIEGLIRPSRLDRSETPKLQQFASLFENKDDTAINSVMVSSIIESLVAGKDKIIFSEEVFLYILQHYCKTVNGFTSVVHSISEFLRKDIDDFKVAEILLLQVMVKFKRNASLQSSAASSAISSLIDAISSRFHKAFCATDFTPPVIQTVLEFYISAGHLKESKVLLTDLVNKGYCPSVTVIESYLELVESTVGTCTSNDLFLKKFVYISNFRPIVQAVLSPKIVEMLIPYCRHFDEILSLLSLIEDSKLKKQIWDFVLPQMIRRAGSLTNDALENSCNLSILYQRSNSFYGGFLSPKVKKSLMVQYAMNNNFPMVKHLMKGMESLLSPNFFSSILGGSANNSNSSTAVFLPGFSPDDKQEYIRTTVLPLYCEMSPAGRLTVIDQADTSEILKMILTKELALKKKGVKSVLSEVSKKAGKLGLAT